MEFRPRRALALLAERGVAFVVVGGIAAAMRGSLRETTDLDVLVERSPENLERLAAVLTELEAKVKGSPRAPMPIAASLLTGMELVTFETAVGEVDVLEIGRGGWTYERVAGGAEEVEIAGQGVRLVSMDDLIAMKRSAGRPKDIETADELEALSRLEAQRSVRNQPGDE
jgi:predicted nucleotidyltransferase